MEGESERITSVGEHLFRRIFLVVFPVGWPLGAWFGGGEMAVQAARFAADGARGPVVVFMAVWCIAWLLTGCVGAWALWQMRKDA